MIIPLRISTLFLAILLVFSEYALAQQRITIQSADEVIGSTKRSGKVRKLIGDVHLSTEQVQMYSDTAYHYLGLDRLNAVGNIEIQTPKEQIWADSLVYFMGRDESRFMDRVIVKSNKTLLFSNRINYFFATGKARFLEYVRLEDPTGILTAQEGLYLEQPDSAIFRQQVQMKDTLKYIEGDSLFMNRQKEHYQIYGRVYVNDGENNLFLSGDSLKADTTSRVLEGNAYMMKIDSAESDTTYIWGNRIIYTKNATTERIDVYENVHIWSEDFSAVSDTALYLRKKQRFKLWGSPRTWHKQIQLTGPYIEADIADGQIETLHSYPSPFAVQQDTAMQRSNQIKGDTLSAFFKSGNIEQIHVRPNSQMLYFTSNEEDSSDGAIRVSARSTRIFFEGDSLSNVKSVKSIKGSFIPKSENPSSIKLKGFSWNPKLRPRRPSGIFNRKWPPISDDRPFKLPPRFMNRQDSASNK